MKVMELRAGDDPSCDSLTLETLIGVKARRVRDFAQERPAVRAGRGRYRLVAFVREYLAFWQDKAENRGGSSGLDAALSFEEARAQKTVAEARIAELDLAEREGRMVSVDVVEEVTGRIADTLRAKLVNLSANYGLHLERAGVAPEAAQAVLEEIADDLTRSLRAAVEGEDEDTDDDGDGDTGRAA